MNFGLLALAFALYGCAQVHQTSWTRIDGAPCLTTHVTTVPWSAETETDCLENGHAVQLTPTSHDDIGMMAGISALVGIILGVSL